MDRKHSSLGRPPPKLRYFKSNKRSCPYQTGNVVRNIEECLDELDSSSDTGSELSALPKTRTLSEDAEVLGIMLLPEMETSENSLCSEKNPLEEFVPERASSPVGLATENHDGCGDGRGRASPLLFEIEGEAPECNAMKIVQSKKAQLTRKDFDESSEVELESPPKKFVLDKNPKAPSACKERRKESCPCSGDEEFLSLQSKKVCVAPVVSSQKNQASDETGGVASKDCEGEPRASFVKSKDHPNLCENGINIASSELKPVEEEIECSAFVLKLKDTGRSKSVGFRKETSPVPASPPLEAEALEDFMILEDENLKSPRWFSIPRRTESKKNKLPHEDDSKAVKHNKEGNAAEVVAEENHSLPQNSKNKQKHSKGTKCKKTNAITTVDQKRERKRIKDVEKRPMDIPASVQSETTQNCFEGQENVVGHTEKHNADVAGEDDAPVLLSSACSASRFEIDEHGGKNSKSNVKPKEKCPKGSRKKPMSQKQAEMAMLSSRPVTESDVALEGHTLGKRKRQKPLSFWLVNQVEQTDVCDNKSSVTVKKRKQSKALESSETIPSSVAERAAGQDVECMPKLMSINRVGKKVPVSKKKIGSRRKARKSIKSVPEGVGLLEECEERLMNGGDDQGCTNPSPCSDHHHTPTPGKKQNKSEKKQWRQCLENSGNHENDRVDTPPTISENEVEEKGHEMGKRKRQKPGSWWLVHREEQTGDGSQGEVPGWFRQRRRPGRPRQPTHQRNACFAQSPLLEKQQNTDPHNQLEGEASEVPVKSSSQMHHREKTVKKRTAKVPPKPRGPPKSCEKAYNSPKTSARHRASRKSVGIPITELPSWGKQYVSPRDGRLGCDYDQGTDDYPMSDQNGNSVSTLCRAVFSTKCSTARSPSMKTNAKQSGRRTLTVDNQRICQFDQLQSEVDVSEGFKSGPSSMIEVDGRTRPPRQNVPHVVSEFHMCGLPLRPMALQVEDREDLVKWLKNVWSSPDGAVVITPEHFQWYAYCGRAMGYRTDLLYETFSNGKILLGSYMTKPLQTDNNAVYVYNILTSTVCVTINGVKMDLSTGETFMIPCGHAYALCNLTAEPAVLLYHRMVTGSPDSG